MPGRCNRVRIIAGRAVAELGDRQTGIDVLLKVLASSDNDISGVEAFNHLEDLDAIGKVDNVVMQKWRGKGSFSQRLAKYYTTGSR